MRRLYGAIGILLLLLAWASPLPGMATHAFYVHMIMHMVVVAVAPWFLVMGIAGTELDPIPTWGRYLMPVPAAVVELLLVWAWHAPRPHHFARESTWGMVLEQSSFFIAGFAVWLTALGGTPQDRRRRGFSGMLGLLLTSMHMTLLGALIALAPRPLYAHASHPHHGLTPALSTMHDQQLGGVIMLVLGGICYLAGGLALAWSLQRAPKERSIP